MKTCTQCGTTIASDSPEGLCGRCLLSVAMKSQADGSAGSQETQAAPASGGASGQGIDIANAGDVARRLPQFEILEILGRGGMGVVYKARQLQLDRIVALKILPPTDAMSPGFVERFRREARSLAKLCHPNIVSVFDFGESNGLFYFVMEFVAGANLRQLIQSQRLSGAEALAVVPKICDALQFAHDEGVVHRDIKPENILIDKHGRVKIADFGLAKLLGRAEADERLTASGATLGTPRYMAPEQVDKPESVDHRADIYSLGVVFYEMLTGELPMGRFAPPSKKVQIDVRLDEIVLHALEQDVSLRYQSIGEVRADVENVTSKPPPTDPPIVSEKVRRARASWLGRRSNAFRAALPIMLLILAIAALALGMPAGRASTRQVAVTTFGKPSPWLELIATFDDYQVTGHSFAMHPLTFSFGCILSFVALILLGQYCMLLDTLVRYGRRFKDLRPEIRRRARWKMGAAAAFATFAPMLILAAPSLIPGLDQTTQNASVKLQPESRAYEWIALKTTFVSKKHQEVDSYRRPNEWMLTILLKPRNDASVSSMDIEMPSLKASCEIHQSIGFEDYRHDIVLDVEEMNKWLQNRCRLEKLDPKAQKEMAELMAMIKQSTRHPPANLDEIVLATETQAPSIGFYGWNLDFSFHTAPALGLPILPTYLTVAGILLALVICVLIRIKREAFALDQAVRDRGERVLARGRLPRVRFGDLPAELRRWATWQGAFVAGILLLLPIGAVVWQRARPEVERHHYRYEFNTESAAIRKLTMACGYDVYRENGETYHVQPKPLRVDMLFDLSDGKQQKLTVQLPGLQATAYHPDGTPSTTVTLDAEELASWMVHHFPSAIPQSQLDLDAADIMIFLKLYSTRVPSTPDVFAGESKKLKRFHSYDSSGQGTEDGFEFISHASYLPAAVFAGILPVFFAAIFLIKRSAVRAAMQRGFSFASGRVGLTAVDKTDPHGSPSRRFQLRPKNDGHRWGVIGTSTALFVFSFLLPSAFFGVNNPGLHIEGQSMDGLDVFCTSITMNLTAWSANPVLWLGWVLLAFRLRWISTIAGSTAFGLAFAELCQPHSVVHLEGGYYCWLASMAVFLVGGIWLAIQETRRRRALASAGIQ